MTAFLKSTWYMTAWNHELEQVRLGRIFIGIPLVLLRGEHGQACALYDRCHHRFAPLSAGELREGQAMCKYHGMRLASSGKCSHNPWGGKTPAAGKFGAYAPVEQDQAVWLEDEALADPRQIPRLPSMPDPGMRSFKGYIFAQANYPLLTDDFMDLYHARFLQSGFGGELYNPTSRVEIGEGCVTACFFVENVDNPEFPECAWSSHVKKLDLGDDITWYQQANLVLKSVVTLHGTPRSEGWVIPAGRFLTPENEHSTHYFWDSAVEQDNPMSNYDVIAVLSQAFDEKDKPMIEGTYKRMAGQPFWALQPVLLSHYVGAIRTRRLLAERISRETQERLA